MIKKILIIQIILNNLIAYESQTYNNPIIDKSKEKTHAIKIDLNRATQDQLLMTLTKKEIIRIDIF